MSDESFNNHEANHKEDQDLNGPIYGADMVELNVGGVLYATTRRTLTHDQSSLLYKIFGPESSITLSKDTKGRPFLDRDGVLFRYILDFLRNDKVVLPENFLEKDRLKLEAEHFRLRKMLKNLETASHGNKNNSLLIPVQSLSSSTQSLPISPTVDSQLMRSAFITIGYRGTFFSGSGPMDMKDVKFRKLSRILVCGKVAVCREVFGDSLNESRDPDRGANERYSSRFFLKHNYLELAFDCLAASHFKLICGCASGTNSSYETPKPGSDNEESKWQHYNEYIFQRV